MKKAILILMSVILALSTIPIVFADEGGSMSNFQKNKNYIEGQFSDVSEDDWFAESVKRAYECGLISGTSETTFTPDSEITFAEVVALVCRIRNIYNGNSYDFKSSTPWYQTYYHYNNLNMLIPFELEPDEKVNRADFAWAFYYALPQDEFEVINDIAEGSIPDAEIYDFAVYTLYRAGIITGSDEYGTFNQADNIKRSEVTAIVTRIVDKSLRVKFELTAKQ